MTEYPSSTPSVKTPSGDRSCRGPKADQAPKGLDPSLSNRVIKVRFDSGGTIKQYNCMMVRERHLPIEEAIQRHEYSLRQKDIIARGGERRKRGRIEGFSKKSRYRLLKKIGSVGRDDPPWFLTLTYRSGSVDFETSKRHLHGFKKMLLRMDKNFGGFWRLEQTTGNGKRALSKTAHYHILGYCSAWNEMSENEFREVVQALKTKWCKVTGDGGEDRMTHGLKITKSYGNQCKIHNYLLGHNLKKGEQIVCGGGRPWGIIGQDNLELGRFKKKTRLTPKQRATYDRIVTKLISSRSSGKTFRLARIKETHLVLDAYNQKRLMDYIIDL